MVHQMPPISPASRRRKQGSHFFRVGVQNSVFCTDRYALAIFLGVRSFPNPFRVEYIPDAGAVIETFLYHAGMEREQGENGGAERLYGRPVEHHPAL